MFTASAIDGCTISEADANLANAIAAGTVETLSRARKAAAGLGAQAAIAQGQIFELAGLNSKAAEAYAKAINHEDSLTACEARARFVIVMLKDDRRSEALQVATRLAALDPKFQVTSIALGETYTSMTLLGDALFVNHRLDAAEQAYRAALEALPGDAYVSGRLALLHLANGKTAAAMELRDAVSKSPRYADLMNTLNLTNAGLVTTTLDPASAVAIVAAGAAGRPFRIDRPRTAVAVERSDWA